LFFIVSKTIGALFTASNILIVIGIAGLILIISRYRSLGQKLLIVCVAGFVICGFLPIGSFLIFPIETRFPAWAGGGAAPDGIIILGGDVDRILAGIKLARQYPTARIVFSGGNGNLLRLDNTTEADYAAELFAVLGLAHERVLFEKQARNTLENAEFCKAMVRPKAGEKWLLVTSAFHMPRSVGTFRKIGFDVEPYPFDFRRRDWPQILTLNSTFLARVNQTDGAIHEWAGLIAYRLRGITTELLPSPVAYSSN